MSETYVLPWVNGVPNKGRIRTINPLQMKKSEPRLLQLYSWSRRLTFGVIPYFNRCSEQFVVPFLCQKSTFTIERKSSLCKRKRHKRWCTVPLENFYGFMDEFWQRPVVKLRLSDSYGFHKITRLSHFMGFWTVSCVSLFKVYCWFVISTLFLTWIKPFLQLNIIFDLYYLT